MKRRLRTLFTTSWYPHPGAPTANVFVREHARAVAEFSEVTVLHVLESHRQPAGTRRLVLDVQETESSGIPTYRAVYRPGHRFLRYASFAAAVYESTRALWRRLGAFDILHDTIFQTALPSILYALPRKRPVLITEHWSGVSLDTLPERHKLVAAAAYQNATFVLPVSKALEAAILRHWPRARTVVVPNPVDTAVFHPPKSRPKPPPFKLLFVGRLVPIKGLDILLHALALLDPSQSPWTLDVVGDGEAAPELREKAQALGLSDRIDWWGTVAHEQVADHMRRAHILVLPSLWENLPCVVIEAQATGLPVVATRVGGTAELVDESSGVLVEPQNPKELAKALGLAMRRLTSFDEWTLAQDVASRYGIEAVARRLAAVYEDAWRNA